MQRILNRLRPARSLRMRLILLICVAIGGLAVFATAQFSSRLNEAYREAGRHQLNGIAETYANGFRVSQLDDPSNLQQRIRNLRKRTETLHKISVSWHGPRNETLLVQDGHEHDPDGTKRTVATSEVRRNPGSRPAPIDANVYGYREIHGADGVHYGELNRRLRTRGGGTAAAIELHYDLATLDAALARDKRTVATAAALAALTLILVLTWILGRAVSAPLEKLRNAAQRIGRGETHTRLDWQRGDEIGVLADDFDRMATELERLHGHLEALALKDPLSGLLNHRAFQERLAQELRRAEREGYSVAVIAIDVDHFKEINDRWGHAVGDEALRLLGKALRAALRPSDICGRVGGDEFMLGLIRSDVHDGEEAVERMRRMVADMRFGPAGQSLTFSAGVSEFPRHSLAIEELTHLADGAMYWAKSNGRNRSYVYSSDADFTMAAQMTADQVMQAGLVNTVHALAKAVDAKDGYTHSHSQRVARYAADLARGLGLDANGVEQVRTAGVLHDVGKIGISDMLLLKPSSLDGDEQQAMRRHSELGRDIVAGAGMDDIARYVYHLHERFDGSGYPDGLSGNDIPLESRILHVADAFEAMTSSRVYRQALPSNDALEELEAGAGTQFDPEIAKRMIELVTDGVIQVGAPDPDAEECPDIEGVPLTLMANGNGTNGNGIIHLNGGTADADTPGD